MRYLALALLAALFVASLDIWVMFWGTSFIIFGLWPLQRSIALPPGCLPLLGLILGISGTLLAQASFPAIVSAITMARRGRLPAADEMDPARLQADDLSAKDAAPTRAEVADKAKPTEQTSRVNRWMPGFGALCGGATVLLTVAVCSGQLQATTAVALLISGALAFIASVHVLTALADGQNISVESYWGGLGGSMGGWRMSPAATMLVIALLFLSAMVALGRSNPSDNRTDPQSGTTLSITGTAKQPKADGIADASGHRP